MVVLLHRNQSFLHHGLPDGSANREEWVCTKGIHSRHQNKKGRPIRCYKKKCHFSTISDLSAYPFTNHIPIYVTKTIIKK